MSNWILVVGYSRPNFEAAQIEWMKYNVSVHLVDTAQEAVGILTHREICMLVECRKVFVGECEIVLTRSEFDILQLLLSQTGRVFTHEQLYLCAFGEDVAADVPINAVRCHISRIRHRLRTAPAPENYIVSVRSVGYQIAI